MIAMWHSSVSEIIDATLRHTVCRVETKTNSDALSVRPIRCCRSRCQIFFAEEILTLKYPLELPTCFESLCAVRGFKERMQKNISRGAMVCGRSERARYKWTRPVQRARSPVIRDNFQLAAGYHRNRASAEERIYTRPSVRTHACRNAGTTYTTPKFLFFLTARLSQRNAMME